MKEIHDFINELGAQLSDEERERARMKLNYLHLQNYSDLWICIALMRIFQKGSFSQWEYLLGYEPFIEETTLAEEDYLSSSYDEKENELSRYLYFCRDIPKESKSEINEYFDITENETRDEELERYLDYLYVKHYLYGLIPYGYYDKAYFENLRCGDNEADARPISYLGF